MLVKADSFLFETPEAQEAADLVSIENDLKQVEACADLILQRSSPNETFDPLRLALLDSAVIRYRRCFTTGLRTSLRRSVVTSVAAPYQQIHDFFHDLGNKHIAHSVSAMENVCAVVHVDNRDQEHPKIVAQAVLHMYGEIADANVVRLKELCVLIREHYIAPRSEALLKAFEEQVAKFPVSRIKKLKPALLPVNLTDDVGKKRWRAV